MEDVAVDDHGSSRPVRRDCLLPRQRTRQRRATYKSQYGPRSRPDPNSGGTTFVVNDYGRPVHSLRQATGTDSLIWCG